VRYNFALFTPHLKEACKRRNTTVDKIARSIGLAPRRVLEMEMRGLQCLDIYRLSQLAERLDVSMDWLCGSEPPVAAE
jgi:hypothetical protein